MAVSGRRTASPRLPRLTDSPSPDRTRPRTVADVRGGCMYEAMISQQDAGKEHQYWSGRLRLLRTRLDKAKRDADQAGQPHPGREHRQTLDREMDQLRALRVNQLKDKNEQVRHERDQQRGALRDARQKVLLSRCESRQEAKSQAEAHAAAMRAQQLSLQQKRQEQCAKVRAESGVRAAQERRRRALDERDTSRRDAFDTSIKTRVEETKQIEESTQRLMGDARRLWQQLSEELSRPLSSSSPTVAGPTRRSAWLRDLNRLAPLLPSATSTSEGSPSPTIGVATPASTSASVPDALAFSPVRSNVSSSVSSRMAWLQARRRALRASSRTGRSGSNQRTRKPDGSKRKAQRGVRTAATAPAADAEPEAPPSEQTALE